MNRLDTLLEEKHSLDRQLERHICGRADPLVEKLLAADTPEERGDILDEFDASLKPFEEMYEALGKTTAKELDRPWYKFW